MVVCVQEYGSCLGGIHGSESCITMLGALLVLFWTGGSVPQQTRLSQQKQGSVVCLKYSASMKCCGCGEKKMNSFIQVKGTVLPGPQEERLCKVRVTERVFHVSSMEKTGEMLSTNP